MLTEVMFRVSVDLEGAYYLGGGMRVIDVEGSFVSRVLIGACYLASMDVSS